jgi:outer membrane protein assembly factor BamB
MQQLKWLVLFVLSPAFLLPIASAATPQNPLIDDDAIYVSHNGVHKFSQTTLKLKWSALPGQQTFAPVKGKTLLYVGSPQGLYALDPDNGRQIWHIESTHTIFSPTIADQLYAGSLHGGLYSIDPATGRINWQQQFDGWIYSPVVLADQGMLWTGGQAHQAFALAINDGGRLHTLALNQESIFSPIDLQNQQIAFNLFSGKTAIINSASAKIEGWLDGSTQPENLRFDDKFIYRSDRDGKLSAFDRKTYRQRWQESIVGQDLTMHPTSDDKILMSNLDNIMVLYDPQMRSEIWRNQIPGNWFSPIQTGAKNIIYFKKTNLQPNELSAVKIHVQPPN